MLIFRGAPQGRDEGLRLREENEICGRSELKFKRVARTGLKERRSLGLLDRRDARLWTLRGRSDLAMPQGQRAAAFP
jgi:hypothetical protein